MRLPSLRKAVKSSWLTVVSVATRLSIGGNVFFRRCSRLLEVETSLYYAKTRLLRIMRAILVGVTCFGLPTAQAQMWGVGSNVPGTSGTSRFYEIVNFSTVQPTVRLIGDTGFISVGDVAVSNSGVIYAVRLASPNSTIYTVNVATGAMTARIQIPANQNGLAWTPGDILYSCGFTPGAANVITRIDLNANSVTPYITMPGSFQGAELAWDQKDELLYAEALNGDLYRIDLGSSTASFVCTLPVQKVGIDIDHTGQMYGAEGNDGSNLFKFHLIDKTNCQMTFIEDFTSTNLGVFGIGVSPVSRFVPALSTWGLIAMLLLLLSTGTVVVMRRRAVDS